MIGHAAIGRIRARAHAATVDPDPIMCWPFASIFPHEAAMRGLVHFERPMPGARHRARAQRVTRRAHMYHCAAVLPTALPE